ncbi:MAG: hypothetical protein ACRCZW_01770 [Lactobacillaceae bacterium]
MVKRRMAILTRFGPFENKSPIKISSGDTTMFGNSGSNIKKLFKKENPGGKALLCIGQKYHR